MKIKQINRDNGETVYIIRRTQGSKSYGVVVESDSPVEAHAYAKALLTWRAEHGCSKDENQCQECTY